MKGRAPIRRTIEYLSSGNLVLKDAIKIFSINYNTYGDHHSGAR
jgi:small subunit ribosomal protein S25